MSKQLNKKRDSATFGHTLEMPALPDASTLSDTPRKTRWGLLILATMGSFLLGISVRYALNDAIGKDFSWLQPAGVSTPIQVNVSSDIRSDLGRSVNAPILVVDVLPFMIRNSQPKYIVLGAYILKDDTSPDKKQPIMVVVPASRAEGIKEDQLLLVSGLVAMDGENGWVTQSLPTDGQNDLRYISERVNYWDRVVILAESWRAYTARQ